VNITERNYYLPFSVFPGIGPKRFSDLLAVCNSAQAIWEASESELKNAHLGEITIDRFITFRKTFSIESYLEKLEKAHVWFITGSEKSYPLLLSVISNPPFVLYGKGEQGLLSEEKMVGVVGTRKVTSYGKQITEQFTRELVQAGCVIVSGLALGVDALAHQTTIDNNGETIAVLGCGVDMCYPSNNERIYQQILEKNGAIVSEYPLSMPPSIGSFPSRNRIIAGLSRVLLVTEGAEDSGALITAEDSRLLGRTVFSIPGPITSTLSSGTNKLLGNGAKLALHPEAILGELGMRKPESRRAEKIIGKTEEEQMVIDLLSGESLSLDELVRKTKLSVSKVSLILSTLELTGIVKDRAGTYTLE
jgi:DNA processing protein